MRGKQSRMHITMECSPIYMTKNNERISKMRISLLILTAMVCAMRQFVSVFRQSVHFHYLCSCLCSYICMNVI